ncbi:hypothetical protein HF086_009284 [Spodoptera exigua]|uniref:AP-3 complex subunit beta n=1 Tax=Spodoptera exigua TaxID=7107 RepID=A0A922MCY9_SPOEX|nr:hypothetical protein HF086_009284 [Spodoptera exigua]
MSATTSYNNDKVVMGEVEYPANDPASGAFFQPDYKKNEDLKVMLDGSKDSLKLEAMKRIIGMIAKGRDASDLFPAVVKNVVSKNIEVKKLVYVYLVRYAEEEQDLALLSISTFQRALKDPNQLIRASALRVLSSIRVPMIVPIVMLAIRDSASDMSPYVRKTAAHAIPKLYSLDPEQKEELVSIIDKLLSDKAPLVVGSAAMAFSEVCGDRMSLIHRSYRKLCSLLADVDEWGQLTLLNVLTVYARTCFADPNSEKYSSDSETEKPFYESDSSGGGRSSPASLDADHRLLLRAAKPLLQSRNSGVVLAVAQLFYHCGPAQELPPVAKAMVRLLRAPLEVQSVVLNSIAALTVTRRTYVTCSDKAFAGATIQAIGRLAVAIHTETETCLNGLLHLLSSKDEWVVCEAVVVVKRVVGGGATSARAAVARAAKLLRSDRLAGAARAAGVWLVAEHGARHPRAAAILAHMAQTFADQDELVKLQLLSLAVKLSITQPDTLPMCRYVVSLARSRSSNSGTSDSESDSDSESGSDSESAGSSESAESSDEETPKKNEVSRDKKQNAQPAPPKEEPMRNEKSNLELLLELDEVASSLPTMTPTCGGFLSPPSLAPQRIGDGEVPVSITPPVGELMRAVTMSQARWDSEHKKLRGMTECDKKTVKIEDEQLICKRVFETANVAAITSTGDFLRFAGRMMSSQDLVLLSVRTEETNSRVTANCANMAIASLLANEVAQALGRS